MNSKSVILFSSPHCSYCRAAKDYFRQLGVSFKEIDISRDTDAARDLQRMTGSQAVPVILINNQKVIGFNKQEINRLLGIRTNS